MNELKIFRKKMKLTQTDLAKMCGVTKPTVCTWENGTRKPDIVMLKRLAMIFDCTTDELLASLPVPEIKEIKKVGKNGNS